MTKRDFFRILIKIFALFSATVSLYTIIPFTFGNALYNSEPMIYVAEIISLILIIALLTAIIFGADRIINLLKLDKGFDEERIDFGNLKEISILKLAIIVIAGILIIDNFPIFINQLFLAFKEQVSRKSIDGVLDIIAYEQFNYFHFAISAMSLLIGYLLITHYPNVATWLLKVGQKNNR